MPARLMPSRGAARSRGPAPRGCPGSPRRTRASARWSRGRTPRVGSGTRISPVARSSASITPAHVVHRHPRAVGAALAGGAVARRRGLDEGLAGGQLAHPVEDAVVGGHDVLGAPRPRSTAFRSWRGRADDVGLGDDARRRLGVDQDHRAGVLRAQELQLEPLELLVDDARAIPHQACPHRSHGRCSRRGADRAPHRIFSPRASRWRTIARAQELVTIQSARAFTAALVLA